MVVRFGFQEIQQLEFLIEILAGPRQVNAIVLEMDHLDVEKLFQDLQLGFLCKQPADHVIDCLLEIADERIGVGRQIQRQVPNLAGQCVGTVDVLLVDWTVEENQVWVDSFSEQFVAELWNFDALADFFVISFELKLLFSEDSADENGLNAGPERLKLVKNIDGCLNDGTDSAGLLKGFESGIVEVLIVIFATELGNKAGFLGLSECKINGGLEGENVEHNFCNLTLTLIIY